jgi:hypothetical protein
MTLGRPAGAGRSLLASFGDSTSASVSTQGCQPLAGSSRQEAAPRAAHSLLKSVQKKLKSAWQLGRSDQSGTGPLALRHASSAAVTCNSRACTAPQ